MAPNRKLGERLIRPLDGVLHGRFFYGWVIVGITFLANLLSAGTGGYTLGLYFASMGRELGWSRTDLSLSRTFSSLVHGVAGPILGGLIDRYGARPIMLSGAVIGAAGLALNYVVTEPWHFYLIYGGIGALGIAEFGNLASSTAVTKWFVRLRGRAIAIESSGVSMGGVLLIPLTGFFIDTFGWRLSWVLVGGLVLVLVFLPTLFLMRNTPEDVGLRPDGDPPEASQFAGGPVGASRRGHFGEVSWTVREALHTRAFWLLIPAFNLSSLGLGAMLLHQIPLIQDKGFENEAATVASAMALFAFLSKLPWGFLVERVHVRYCFLLSSAVSVCGLVILLGASSLPQLFAYAVVFGIGIGASTILNPVAWANYFGRAFVGTIRGIVTPFQVLSGAFAPLYAGMIYDRTGSYQVALLTFIGTYLLSGVFIFLARQPQRASVPASPPAESRIHG